MTNQVVALVFPHQLFEQHPAIERGKTVVLIEEFLFFKQYRFHKQKLVLHRATMQFYRDFLQQKGFQVEYVEANAPAADVRVCIKKLSERGVSEIHYADVADNWLERRLTASCARSGIKARRYDSPNFINTLPEIERYYEDKKRYFQTDFYVHQRKTRSILLEKNGKPLGGKWTFDTDNRDKYPKGQHPPPLHFPAPNQYVAEAWEYVERHFPDNYGTPSKSFLYPVTFADSVRWLDDFLEYRFAGFGPYEDAMVSREHFLHHSVLTPMLNVGLLQPDFILQKAIEYATKNDIPLNSLEGFVRQILGWREFVRAVYVREGSRQRTTNYWRFSRSIPPSFWNGTTGIEPVDAVIRKVLRTGYCHHIERLMVLGNFMLLCEFAPDEVYRWFMEMFVDAYDWVMVPNVYGMTQFADGGLMTTKPYVSGSNYLVKMSDFEKGDWQTVWDGLFWRFMHVHRDFFRQNPRLGMLVKTFDNMDAAKRQAHLDAAESLLRQMA
ncbi:MAG: cryptochrome/photolyase family protein [Saprospiraceae bacterium]|nr:cryptochrome/photolyase family protein [Saprospiraceae bacterium]